MCIQSVPPSLPHEIEMNSLKSLQLPNLGPELHVEFVDPNPDYVCIVCKEHFYSPYQLQCGHRICSNCYAEVDKNHLYYSCSSGDTDCEESRVSEIRPDYSVMRELAQKQVYCTNQKDGCREIVQLKYLKRHLDEECFFGLVDCPYSCGTSVMRRNKLNDHKQVCPKKPHNCSFRNLGCNFKGSPSDMENHMKDSRVHLDCTALKLKEMEVESVNLMRKQEDLSHKYSDIVQACTRLETLSENKIVKASSLISRVNDTRGEILKRLSTLEMSKNVDMEFRRRDVWKEVDKQDRILADLQEKLKKLELSLVCLSTTNYSGVLIWKVSEFSRRIQAAREGRSLSLYSQPFYTSRYGYKMCARVYLNGDGIGKNTHVSLFFVVMQGDYDDILPWPFRNKVTLMLLDQKNLSNNVVDTFLPDPRSTSFQKPTSEMNIASGSPKFVNHADLSRNEAYLKNDVLFFKIVVSEP